MITVTSTNRVARLGRNDVSLKSRDDKGDRVLKLEPDELVTDVILPQLPIPETEEDTE